MPTQTTSASLVNRFRWDSGAKPRPDISVASATLRRSDSAASCETEEFELAVLNYSYHFSFDCALRRDSKCHSRDDRSKKDFFSAIRRYGERKRAGGSTQSDRQRGPAQGGPVIAPRHHPIDGKPYKVYPAGKVNFSTYPGCNPYPSVCHVCHGHAAVRSSFAPSLLDSPKLHELRRLRHGRDEWPWRHQFDEQQCPGVPRRELIVAKYID